MSKKELIISEDELDNIMASIHESINPTKQKGEFTTLEYAEKCKLTVHQAMYDLTKAQARGIVSKRQPGGRKTEIFWKPVK